MIRLTVSEDRVGLFKPALEAIVRPEYILFHKGVNHNAGKLMLVAADKDAPNSIRIDYDRKKISFFSRDFINICKDMIREYAAGEFSSGVFYAVKGKQQGENMIVFDFREVAHHHVKPSGKVNAKKARAKKAAKKTPAKNPLMQRKSPLIRRREDSPCRCRACLRRGCPSDG